MGLNSWAERLRRQTHFGSEVDSRYIPTMVARLREALAADEEDRIARREDRASARTLQQAQLDAAERERRRGAVGDVEKYRRATVRRGPDGTFSFAGPIPAEILAGLDPETASAVDAGVLAAAESEQALREAARTAKTTEEIAAEERAVKNALRVAGFTSSETAKRQREDDERRAERDRAERAASAGRAPDFFRLATEQVMRKYTGQPGAPTLDPARVPGEVEATARALEAAWRALNPGPTMAAGEGVLAPSAQGPVAQALSGPGLGAAMPPQPPAMVKWQGQLVPFASLPPAEQARVMAALSGGR